MQTVLVIGIAGGVGKEVAGVLLERGYQVCGSVLNQAEAQAIRASYPSIRSLTILDFSNADPAVNVLTGFLLEHSIDPDAVVICSGIAPFGPLETMPLAGLRRTLEINTVACVAVFQACLPALRRTKGKLVIVGSMAGKVGMPFLGHYVASKFALEGLVDVMRQEVFKWEIGISLVEPGGSHTPLVDNGIIGLRDAIAALAPDEAARYGSLYRQYLLRLETSLPTLTTPSTVATAIIDILESTPMVTRREVGPDAERLCESARTMSDEARDQMFRTAYNGALDRP